MLFWNNKGEPVFKSKEQRESLENLVCRANLVFSTIDQYKRAEEVMGQVVKEFETAHASINSRADAIENQYCNQNTTALEAKYKFLEHSIRDVKSSIADVATKLNLLMGFLKIEEYEIPEVPPTPGIPARVDMRKVTGK